nr:ribosome biogenesis GTPase YlqF [bacterium]
MRVNWYPGQMAKARRMLVDSLSLVDVVLEVADARVPYASRNPDLALLCAAKPRVLLLNKADLAAEAVTQAWIAHYRAAGEQALPIVSTRPAQAKKALAAIDRAARDAVERAGKRGMKKTVRALVAGVPNSGKSTFINALAGAGSAKTGDKAGVTRGKQWIRVGPYLELLDTPGLLWPRLDDQAAARRLAYVGSVSDDAIDFEGLARSLLAEVTQRFPGIVSGRYNGVDESLGEDELLEAVCRKMGWLLSGGISDVQRGARAVLDQFRAGKWGRLSLESPDMPLGQVDSDEA